MAKAKPTIPQLPIEYAADLLGVGPRRVAALIDEGRLTKGVISHITGESFAAYIRELRAKEMEKKHAGDYEADKARKMKADADMAEIEASKAAAKLVEGRTVERTWQAAIVGAKTRLLSLPARLGPQAVIQPSAQAATELIDREMRAALAELGSGKPDRSDAEGAGE